MTVSAFSRARIACVGVAFALMAFGAATQSASAQTKTIRLGWTAIPSNIPVKIAEEQGFYKKYGLSVKLTDATASGAQLPALGKQYDILVATVADVLLYAGKKGDPVVLNTGIVDTKKTATQNLLVEKGITSLKQLKGKTICTITVGNGQQYVAAYIALQKAGLNPKKDVKFLQVPFPNMLDSLKAGRCDAAATVQPYINQIKAAGYGGLNNTLLSVAKQAPGTMYVTRSSLIKKDKKKFQAFQKAYTDAVNFCKKNENECVQSVVKNLGTNINAARTTPWQVITPKTKNTWVTDWIKPMERAGFLKKGRVKTSRKFVL